MTNWPEFKFDLRYNADAIRNDLINIEAFRLSLNQLHLPREWQMDLQKLYIVRAVHGTTAIEGNPLTEEQISQQFATKKKRQTDQVHRQTENAAAAFRWVEDNFKDRRNLRLEDVLTMHKILTTQSDEHENTPGKLRESGHNVTVGSPQLGGVHNAPPGGEITKKLTTDFLEFVNSTRFRNHHAVVQALIAHFYFVTLHPFGNGNGRTTRCLEASILFGSGYNMHGFYSLSNFFYRNRDDYFRMLQETRTKHRYDMTAFIEFGTRGFREELERINAYVRNRIHHLQYREMIRRCESKKVGARRRLLNERETALLHGILDFNKPADPFSAQSTKDVSYEELRPLFRLIYKEKGPRTIWRELLRLDNLGFVAIDDSHPSMPQWTLRVRFDAIEKY